MHGDMQPAAMTGNRGNPGETPGNLCGRVVAVIVSRDRPEELRATIMAVQSQICTTKLAMLVVDSSEDSSVTEEFQDVAGITVLRSEINLGGAGGFALGIIGALARGASWIWLMDDDGRPASHDVLQGLLNGLRARQLDAIAPAVLDPGETSRFAFPYPVNGRYLFNRADVAPDAFIPNFAHLFNGLLVNAATFFSVGLPDLRLFLRGDEVDFLFRLRRAKQRFGTLAAVAFTHPSSKNELYPIFGGRLHVVYPGDPWRRAIQYRNRGYNFVRHRQYKLLAVDAVRYPYFFLIERKFDVLGLKEWAKSMWCGMTGRIHGSEPGQLATTPARDLA
jgi:rhamnopyranosyl-N-acetylglucosaminyl-diphospho-decaprenol beta-1,3/1,4-galactofuranosyltransferase